MMKFKADRMDGRVRSKMITVRFVPEAFVVLRTEAQLRGITVAELMRLIVAHWVKAGRP